MDKEPKDTKTEFEVFEIEMGQKPDRLLSDEEMELDWTDDDGNPTDKMRLTKSELLELLAAQDLKTAKEVNTDWVKWIEDNWGWLQGEYNSLTAL